jgi:hypothetical protein
MLIKEDGEESHYWERMQLYVTTVRQYGCSLVDILSCIRRSCSCCTLRLILATNAGGCFYY